MRRRLAILLAATLLLAGCIGGEEAGTTTTTAEDGMADDTGQEPLPEPIADTQEVLVSADQGNFAGMGICQTPTAECWEYPFEANTTINVTGTLTWEVPLNDFDLYLLDGDEQVAVGGDPPPETEEVAAQDIGPGEYRLVVVAWLVVDGTFTLEGTFDHA